MISGGDRTELICLNLLNIRSKICRQSLILCIILNLVGNLTNKTKDTKKNQALFEKIGQKRLKYGILLQYIDKQII